MLEENKAVIRRYFDEVMGQEDLAAASELVSADYLNHSLANPAIGFVSLRQRITSLRSAFPDAKITLEDLIAEGEKVIARWTLRGTHQGLFHDGLVNNVAPTGKPVTMTAISIFRVENGKIVECWSERDRLGRLHQLGVLAPLIESFAQAPAPDAPAPDAPTRAA